MNLVALAWSYLRARPLSTLLNTLLLALGVGTIGFVWIVDAQIGESLNRDARGIDLVVGAKGSPLQLILAGIYHLDAPTGNIPLKEARELSANPLIRRVVPLSLGDSFRGFRIVGTTPDYIELYGGALGAGRIWNDSMQAVLGAAVARHTGLGVGDRFVGSHGLSEGGPTHSDAVYGIVGVLQPTGTVLDRLVLVNTDSVWFVHEGRIVDPDEKKVMEEERQVQYATPLAAASLPRRINAETNLQAASPAYESARLFRMIGVGADVIRAFGGVVLLTAALSLFIALYHALNERAYDIAVLRTLGARPASIALMLEAMMLAVLGGALAARARAGRDPRALDERAGQPAHQRRSVFRRRTLAAGTGAGGGSARGAYPQLARGAGQHLGHACTEELTQWAFARRAIRDRASVGVARVARSRNPGPSLNQARSRVAPLRNPGYEVRRFACTGSC